MGIFTVSFKLLQPVTPISLKFSKKKILLTTFVRQNDFICGINVAYVFVCSEPHLFSGLSRCPRQIC